MKTLKLHQWQFSTAEAIALQKDLAKQVSRTGSVLSPRFIGGVDISINRITGTAAGAVVVLSYPELELVEVEVVDGKPGMPYIPGLLSFREAPLALAAFDRLSVTPDLVLVDGQGIAHPRRIGIASHLGLFLDTPTIGCAKSLLCGDVSEPDTKAGSFAEINDKDETIGAAVRTRQGVKPVYVSIGHKLDLQTAISWVLQCSRGYRLPEPVRLAHLAAGGNLKAPAKAAS